MLEHRLEAQSQQARDGVWRLFGRRPIDRALLKTLDGVLCRHGIGRLNLTMPSGESADLGRAGTTQEVALTLNRYRALWRLFRGGALGFAESYMNGDIDTDDLKSVFDFYVENEPALNAAVPAIEVTPGHDRRLHGSRSNTRAGSRRNIAAHYDLGNAFYRLWLDPGMLYSSGIYRDANSSLESAQQEKLAHILDALDIRPGYHVLEIGCGWGALAEGAARRGARVDAITISEQQDQEARTRIATAGFNRQVDVRYLDYRDTTGTYDRLVSIEMIEAVGEDHWPLYFETIAKRLRPTGIAVIQAITIRDDLFPRYRQNPDFIQRYIFPGGMLPTGAHIASHALAAGLEFEEIERFGASYALTLRDWRRRFEAAWPRIAALGFDERFRRMWLYYLVYCEIGFERGMIDVGLYRLRKPV